MNFAIQERKMLPSTLPMLGLALFLLVTVGNAALTKPSRAPTQRPSQSCGDDPLSCYLNAIVIPFPDTCVEFDKLQLCLTDFACYGIFLSSLPSQYIAPTTLGVGMDGVGTSCDGNYQYGLVSGTLSATITNTDFYIDLLVDKEGEYPVATSFSFCNVSSINVNVDFTGGAAVDGLEAPLEILIVTAVDVLICDVLAEFVAINVTKAIVDELDPKLEDIVSSQPSIVPYYGSNYLNWHNSILNTIHTLLETVDIDTSSGGGPGPIKTCLTEQVLPTFMNSIFFKESATVFFQSSGNEQFFLDLTALTLPAESTLTSSVSMMGGLNATITVTTVSFQGFDTINSVELLQPMNSSNVTLHTQLSFDSLQLQIGLNLYIEDPDVDGFYNETVVVVLNVTDVTLVMDLTLAVDMSVLDALYMDQLKSSDCWFSAIAAINIPNLQLHLKIEEFSILEVQGDAGQLEDDIAALISNALLLVIDGFGELTTDVINGFAQGPLRAGINTYLSDNLALRHAQSTCPAHVQQNGTNYVVWANSTIILAISNMVQAFGPQGINNLINCVTGGTGSLKLNVSAVSISIGGLNSFYELAILDPVGTSQPYNLINEIALGYCPSPENCNPLSINIANNGYDDEQRMIESTGEKKQVSSLTTLLDDGFVMSDWKISMTLENLQLYLDLYWEVDKSAMSDLQFVQLHTTGCIKSTYAALAIADWSLAVTEADVTLIDASGQTTHLATNMVNAIFARILNPDKMEEYNSDMAEQISVAGPTCENGGVTPDSTGTAKHGYGSDNETWQIEMAFLGVGCALALGLLVYAYHYFGRQSKFVGDKEGISTMFGVSSSAVSTLWDRWDCNNGLLFNKKIPILIRCLLPMACIADMGMFLNSNLIPNAVSVMTQVIGPSHSSDPIAVFEFGLKSTVEDMWNAKVYPLAILIAFFSGAWPYMKLAIMFVCWCVPPGLLPVAKREGYLEMLDLLGKWSLIDFYVMVMFICAFYCELHIGNNLIVEVTVLPRWGFYGFLLATMVSLGLGHICLACHRLVVDAKIPQQLDDRSEKVSLLSFTYKFPEYEEDITHVEKDLHRIVTAEKQGSYTGSDGHDNAGAGAGLEDCERDDSFESSSGLHGNVVTNALQSGAARGGSISTGTNTPKSLVRVKVPFLAVQITTIGKVALVLLLLLTILAVIGGMFTDTMNFEFKGLVGYMLGNKAIEPYSYNSIGMLTPKYSGLPANDFAIHWVQACWYLFGIGMPLSLMVLLLYLWLVPMNISRLREAFVLAEIFNAWQAVDVFCVSIIAALTEIQQFAAFIVGDSCDGINKILEKEFFNDLLDGDDKCFDVIATMKTNVWIVFTAAGLLLVVGISSLAISHFAIKSRMQTISQTMLDAVIASVASGKKLNTRKTSTDMANDPSSVKAAVENGTWQEHSGSNNESEGDFSAAVSGSVDSVAEEEEERRADSESLNVAAQTAAVRFTQQSYWQRCTKHNFTVQVLRGLAKLKLVHIEESMHKKGLSFDSLTRKQQRRARAILQKGFEDTSGILPLLAQAEREEDDDDDADDAGEASDKEEEYEVGKGKANVLACDTSTDDGSVVHTETSSQYE